MNKNRQIVEGVFIVGFFNFVSILERLINLVKNLFKFDNGNEDLLFLIEDSIRFKLMIEPIVSSDEFSSASKPRDDIETL